MTRSSEPDLQPSFGSLDALTRTEGERRGGGRRLQDRIAQREAEQGQPAAALPLIAGAERRRPSAVDRRLAAERLDPLPSKPSYARFIPREEVGQVSNFPMSNFGGPPVASAEAAPPEDPQVLAQRAAAEAARQVAAAAQARADELRATREQAYQDGYRDGLAALEAFKHSHAAQTTAQFIPVLNAFQAQLAQLELHLAARVAGIAMEVARQVVRQELQTHPERVVAVTREAMGLVLSSARHIVVRLHPDDHAMVSAGLSDLLTARHARLSADTQIERGGCVVSSDIGVVDAGVATRWQRMMATMGMQHDWPVEDAPAAGPETKNLAPEPPTDGAAA
jgi:flagellar assembly protein FliH